MTLDQSAVLELLGELKLTDVSDRIRHATEKLYQELIDSEAAAVIGAAPFERSPERVTQRNGTRSKTVTTTAGQLDLRIPKLRQGSFFPSLLERRRRVDQALFAVVMEASRVAADGRREVLGFDVGDTESEPFWTDFFRSLKARGLGGVKLVVSDAHSGLVPAIAVAFQGSSWQRCRVHFIRNVLAKVPKVAGPMVAAIIRTVFVPRGKKTLVHAQFDEVVAMLQRSHPAVADMLDEARDDLLAFAEFPPAHWQQIWSTNPLERLNKEVKRRTNVVGTFPNPAALLRQAGHVPIEQHDEWDAADRRYISENSMKLLNSTDEEVTTAAIDAA